MTDEWSGRHKGERVIVGGWSPHIHSLPREFLQTGKVIGINQWGAELPCDYWIGLDTGVNWEKHFLDTKPEYAHLPKFLRTLNCPRFMRKPYPDSEAFVPEEAGVFFDKVPHDAALPEEWNGTLKWISSTAMAAIHLAIIMGASEVVLYGVDFVGNDRADGSSYPSEKGDFWRVHKENVNNLVRLFQQYVPVYKLHPESWLECPLKVIDERNPMMFKPEPTVEAEAETVEETKATKPAAPPDFKALEKQEKAKYEKVWTLDAYRVHSPAVRNLGKFFNSIHPEVNDTVADYGCGSGMADLVIREKGCRVVMVDIAENCLNPEVKEALLPGFLDFKEANLWDLPRDLAPTDWFYCCDVMEHIPEEAVDRVLENIRDKTLKGGYFNIATYQDGHFGALSGEVLHLTVKNADWWIDKISKYFLVVPVHIDDGNVTVTAMKYPE